MSSIRESNTFRRFSLDLDSVLAWNWECDPVNILKKTSNELTNGIYLI